MTITSSMTNLAQPGTSRPLITPMGWGWIGVLGVLFIAFHHVFLLRTWYFAISDNDWSHALVVPLIAGYYIFQKRETLAAMPQRICWWGLPIFLAGLFGYSMGIYPIRNDMAQGYSMILALGGLVLMLLGPRMMTVLWFPVVYLVFAVKISNRIWEPITWKLQHIAASGSVLTLKFLAAPLNFDAHLEGTTIHLSYLQEPLNVAEACSGMRMLLAFMALAVAMAFLWDRAWWQRLIMVLMAVPIALAVNIGRVTAIALLARINGELAQGSFHQFVGLLMLIPAALLFLLLGWVLDQIILRDDKPAKPAPPPHADRQTEPRSNTPPINAWGIAQGAATGVGLTLVLGLIYALLLWLVRPDLFLSDMPQALVIAMLLGLFVLLVLGGWQLLRITRGSADRRPSRATAVLCSVMAGMLLAGMFSQQVVIAATQAVLFKEKVDLRHPFMLFPDQLGTWELVEDYAPLSAEIVETLGTDQYISRKYRDTAWPSGEPGGEAHVHVAYYTGTADTVPHVPERCYVAGGVFPLGTSRVTLALEGLNFYRDPAGEGWMHPALLEPEVRLPAREIDVTRFSYSPSASAEHSQHVFYFFIANGQYLPNPDHVRLYGINPRDRYSYYCKVEVQMINIADEALAAERAAQLLSQALPQVMANLPDWTDVLEGRWPEPDAPRTAGAAR